MTKGIIFLFMQLNFYVTRSKLKVREAGGVTNNRLHSTPYQMQKKPDTEYKNY